MSERAERRRRLKVPLSASERQDFELYRAVMTWIVLQNGGQLTVEIPEEYLEAQMHLRYRTAFEEGFLRVEIQAGQNMPPELAGNLQ